MKFANVYPWHREQVFLPSPVLNPPISEFVRSGNGTGVVCQASFTLSSPAFERDAAKTRRPCVSAHGDTDLEKYRVFGEGLSRSGP